MNKDLSLFKHIYINKQNPHIFIVFHGIGGNEHDLIPLVENINPDYSILSLRGNIQENGMNRFFERYQDGSFNFQSVGSEVENLHIFLNSCLKTYNFSLNNVVLTGYSNGANFALSYLFKYPDTITKAILFHPMLPYHPDNISMKKSHIFFTSGKNESFTTTKESRDIQEVLTKCGSQVTHVEHPGGHELREVEISRARDFIKDVND